jgi:hypothetical protein
MTTIATEASAAEEQGMIDELEAEAALAEMAAKAEAEEKPKKAAAKTKKVANLQPPMELFDLGSIGIKVERPRPMSEKFSAVIYGKKGVGKSTLAASAAKVPELSPVLFLAVEDGSSVLDKEYSDDPNLDVVYVEDWATGAAVIGAVANNQTKYKTVIVDTMSELQEHMKEHTSETGYGLWAFIADNSITTVKMLHRSKFVNVIFTTHAEKLKEEDSGKVLMSPFFLGKKTIEEALKPIDLVLYLALGKDESGQPVHVLQTKGDGKIDASDRSGELPFQMGDPTFADIYPYLARSEQ